MKFRNFSLARLIPAVAIMLVGACSQPVETVEQYAKNPIGCDSKPAQWYADKAVTKAGIDELRARARTFRMRSDHHGSLVHFDSISEAEKKDHLSKVITCLREEKWSLEILAKAGAKL